VAEQQQPFILPFPIPLDLAQQLPLNLAQRLPLNLSTRVIQLTNLQVSEPKTIFVNVGTGVLREAVLVSEPVNYMIHLEIDGAIYDFTYEDVLNASPTGTLTAFGTNGQNKLVITNIAWRQAILIQLEGVTQVVNFKSIFIVFYTVS
jgi:hypothetical protein